MAYKSVKDNKDLMDKKITPDQIYAKKGNNTSRFKATPWDAKRDSVFK